MVIVFSASSECSSADKTEMTTQCPLHDTIHREKGQRKQALEKSSLSEEVSHVQQKELCERSTKIYAYWRIVSGNKRLKESFVWIQM